MLDRMIPVFVYSVVVYSSVFGPTYLVVGDLVDAGNRASAETRSRQTGKG